jgi:hypothetical protein
MLPLLSLACLRLNFCEAKGQELKNSDAPGHRFCDAALERSFLRPREQPLTHAARLGVDQRADVGKQLRSILNLVEYNRRLQFLKKGTRITSHSRLHTNGIDRREPAQAAEVYKGLGKEERCCKSGPQMAQFRLCWLRISYR